MARIVFCEDDMFLQKLVRLILRSTKHEVFIASDGLEGFSLIERVHPDLILTDISMPRWDGFQLADAVKARPDLAAIPIVFVTAFAQRIDVEEGTLQGTGLGLSITRQIIQMQRGHIWVESRLGQGSCFRFTIPLTPTG